MQPNNFIRQFLTAFATVLAADQSNLQALADAKAQLTKANQDLADARTQLANSVPVDPADPPLSDSELAQAKDLLAAAHAAEPSTDAPVPVIPDPTANPVVPPTSVVDEAAVALEPVASVEQTEATTDGPAQ